MGSASHTGRCGQGKQNVQPATAQRVSGESKLEVWTVPSQDRQRTTAGRGFRSDRRLSCRTGTGTGKGTGRGKFKGMGKRYGAARGWPPQQVRLRRAAR